MSETRQFKCPSCGGYIEFEPSSQQFRCPYCGTKTSVDDLHEEESAYTSEPVQHSEGESAYRSYNCTSCGAQIVTGDTTAATRCYYCHNPVVLSDRLAGDFRPDGVIPFALDKKGAVEAFQTFIKGKKFVDHSFYSSAQLEDFSGVYYPYWMADIEGESLFVGEGTRVSVRRSDKYTTTTTRYYMVQREGRLIFTNLFRKGLKSADRTLSEGIHPYHYNEVKSYEPAYLSGFMAEMRDVEEQEVREDLLKEIRHETTDLMREGHNYTTLTGTGGFRSTKERFRYTLLPAWVLTYKGGKDDKLYYYMMNGQTGEVCGKLPINKGKLFAWCAGIAAAVFAVLCAGGATLW